MANITYRLPAPVAPGSTTFKSAPLTNAEIDGNFKGLQDEMALKSPLASPVFTGSVTIPGGTINSTTIGATTPSSGAFTTLSASGATTITDATASSSTSTGALVITGGLGVGGNVYATGFYGIGTNLTALSATNLSSGTVERARGGTGQTAAFVAGGVVYGSTVNALACTPIGTTGQVLTSNAAGAPTWADPASGVTLSTTTENTTVVYPVLASATGVMTTGVIDDTTTPLTYVPSTGTLTATIFSGSGASLTSLPAVQLTGTVAASRGVSAGSASASFLEYNGTAAADAKLYGGATDPTQTTRLNYGGYFYATRLYGPIYGSGANLTGTATNFTSSASTNATITDDASTNSNLSLIFAGATGVTGLKSVASLTINPSTGRLTATSFGGNGSALTSVQTGTACTFNNGGAGAASGTTFNGSTARTISYNTIGAPSTTGTNASGTWAITVSGGMSAGSITTTTNTVAVGSTSATNVQFMGDASNPAVVTFNRASTYALNMGIDTDNIFRLGGGSQGSNNYRFTSDTSGNFVALGNVTAYSDARLKENLCVIPDAVEKVKSLTGYTYTRTDTGEKQTGLLAQDLQVVLPEAVSEADNGYLSVAYGNIVGLLVEAIKEQQKQIEELKALIGK